MAIFASGLYIFCIFNSNIIMASISHLKRCMSKVCLLFFFIKRWEKVLHEPCWHLLFIRVKFDEKWAVWFCHKPDKHSLSPIMVLVCVSIHSMKTYHDIKPTSTQSYDNAGIYGVWIKYLFFNQIFFSHMGHHRGRFHFCINSQVANNYQKQFFVISNLVPHHFSL